MSVENGEWIMHGLDFDDPGCIRTVDDLEDYIEEVGFVPLFGNGIRGFSVEEHTDPRFWWTDDEKRDPWKWREIIARRGKIAYGKFFDKKAGFISLRWLPYFANYRRDGYDFDARWEDGLINRREKTIMDLLTDTDEDGDMIWPDKRILSTELKKMAGFGKTGAKNYPGTITNLQMQTYLVIRDFVRRTNKRGEEYGMPVSILQPPETIWGYETVTSAYNESPSDSRQKIIDHIQKICVDPDEFDIIKLVGK
ncbi:MAG: hypothetical protein K6G12_10660 [Lachnospiraceae bacterium]|nr:hypothetical protein [Lachnospiraceae bacterium]